MADIRNLAYLSTRNRPVRYYSKPNIQWEAQTTKGATDAAKQRVLNFPDESKWSNFAFNQLGVSSLTSFLSKYYTFPHVQTIDIKYARDITELYGLQAFSILPWYTKAVVVTIRGLDYLGAFVSAGSLPGVGKLVTPLVLNQMRDEMIKIDNVLSSPGVVNTDNANQDNQGFLSALTIGIAGEKDRIELMGFIKGLDINETVEKPFLHTYTVTYIGLDNYFYYAKQASTATDNDKEKVPGIDPVISGASTAPLMAQPQRTIESIAPTL